MNPILISAHNCRRAKTTPLRVFAAATAASLLLIAGMSSSCRTMNGVGQDVEKGGEKIQNAATR